MLDGVTGNRVVSGELVQRTIQTNLLGRRSSLNLLLTSMTRRSIRANVQAAAWVVNTSGSSAGTNSSLQTVLVLPALEVVTVKSVTSRVTHSPDKTVGVFNGASIVEKLVEDGQDGLGVGFGADAKVVVANGRERDL